MEIVREIKQKRRFLKRTIHTKEIIGQPKKNKWINFFFFFFFVISVMSLLLGNSIFWKGYHNMDLCSNERYIEIYIKPYLKNNITFDFNEFNNDGNKISLEDCYIMGVNQLIKGFYLSLYSAFLIGFIICIFYINFNLYKFQAKGEK